MIERIVEFCNRNLNLNSVEYSEPYQSLDVCIIDVVYSLRAKYFQVTVPIVQRYADKFMNGDRLAKGYTLSDLMDHIDSSGGAKKFASNLLKNNQQISGRLKSEICYELARKLRLLNIETIEDFNKYEHTEIMEIIIRSVKGMGPAGLNYLFMLAGDPNRCKPDVHIHRFIYDATGRNVTDEECQTLLTEAVKTLRFSYPNITVRTLDSIIWNEYQIQNKKRFGV
ncbi:MAG: hypothetical protein JXR48_00600 [Candidatus Delongbacteria bacterium]|nr:hypothetical protein [Candidatus Delongbacteria bacterium]